MDIIFSVKPKFCERMRRFKTIELRNKIFSIKRNVEYGFIYCSKSELKKYSKISGKIIASFDCNEKNILRNKEKEEIWKYFSKEIDICYSEFFDYCNASNFQNLIFLKNYIGNSQLIQLN